MKNSLENLKPLMRCSVCDKKYEPAKVLVLSSEEERTTLHLTCEHCQVSSLIFVSSNQWGVASVGVLTDLGPQDARALFGQEAISADQVIEMHAFFKHCKGDVTELI
ncbi:MAG: hypothetical protein MN733_06900 [Nitrososphaera sp.]|nr:hypothetical protein [Nitrososphaera sp.]